MPKVLLAITSAYEDFTHITLFTAGSLYYVLKMAGFNKITFVNPLCIEGLTLWKRVIRIVFYRIYVLKAELWNFMTVS